MTGTDSVMGIGSFGWIYSEGLLVWGNVAGELKGHTSQILSSLHLLQTSPGLISAIFVAVSSMSISKDLVMGFCKCHASLRSVALPSWDSSGV